LHPGNILVTKRFYREASIITDEEYDYLLTDFGAGGYVGGDYVGYHSVVSRSGRFERHVGEYVAPEVENGGSVSAEADVFSLGCIGSDLVSLRRTITAEEGSMDWKNVPKALKTILEDCTASNPLERPQIFPLTTRIEDLPVCDQDLMEDETAWCVWDDVRSDLTILATDAAAIQPGDVVVRARAQVDEMLRRFG
jgi:serine/threonine protein kinase